MKNLTKNYLLLLLIFFTLGNVNAQNSRTSTNDKKAQILRKICAF
ncbi:hypothetical protein SAMN05421866_0591 [Chryseobacterium oranimense]|uniref:Uncharacterized protein n=1 Tax=Chryseobacterium oranimense TaxID=421058 RepID=A0A1M5K6P7_9FLAO|nr:hypothetical protein SAMN05421866_0591 [Chryseobacterium oranimense]